MLLESLGLPQWQSQGTAWTLVLVARNKNSAPRYQLLPDAQPRHPLMQSLYREDVNTQYCTLYYVLCTERT